MFHILQDMKNAEIRALYWKRKKKSKFNRLQIEVFITFFFGRWESDFN